MERQLYTRWSHLGTYYGFTPYSSVTIASGEADSSSPREGQLIHRMFDTRYYIMAVIALFYRARLLDFLERVALVSKHLYFDQQYGRSHLDNIQIVGRIRAEFLLFNSHWYFDELKNKDEEQEHFEMQCEQYRMEVIRRDIQQELDALSDSLMYFQFRATEAVNRLAFVTMMLGCAAVGTGFYGKKFGHVFDFLLKPEPGREWMFWASRLRGPHRVGGSRSWYLDDSRQLEGLPQCRDPAKDPRWMDRGGADAEDIRLGQARGAFHQFTTRRTL